MKSNHRRDEGYFYFIYLLMSSQGDGVVTTPYVGGLNVDSGEDGGEVSVQGRDAIAVREGLVWEQRCVCAEKCQASFSAFE